MAYKKVKKLEFGRSIYCDHEQNERFVFEFFWEGTTLSAHQLIS
jgi:hypothetical protein